MRKRLFWLHLLDLSLILAYAVHPKRKFRHSSRRCNGLQGGRSPGHVEKSLAQADIAGLETAGLDFAWKTRSQRAVGSWSSLTEQHLCCGVRTALARWDLSGCVAPRAVWIASVRCALSTRSNNFCQLAPRQGSTFGQMPDRKCKHTQGVECFGLVLKLIKSVSGSGDFVSGMGVKPAPSAEAKVAHGPHHPRRFSESNRQPASEGTWVEARKKTSEFDKGKVRACIWTDWVLGTHVGQFGAGQ